MGINTSTPDVLSVFFIFPNLTYLFSISFHHLHACCVHFPVHGSLHLAYDKVTCVRVGACLDTEVIRVLGTMRGGWGLVWGGVERNAGPHRRRKDNQKMGGRRSRER